MTPEQVESLSRLTQARFKLVEAAELANKQARQFSLRCDPEASSRMLKIHTELTDFSCILERLTEDVVYVHEEHKPG